MKKSEYTIARRNVWVQGQLLEGTVATLVNRDVAAAEAAGVVWDPEEEPLPERVEYSWSLGVQGVAFEQLPRVYAEAFRRYNLVPRMVAALMNRGGGRLDIEIIGEALRIAAGDK